MAPVSSGPSTTCTTVKTIKELTKLLVVLTILAAPCFSVITSQKQNTLNPLKADLGGPVVKFADLVSFRSNKIVILPNNDFANITGSALNVATEDADSGLLIRPQMMNNFEAINFVGDTIQSITDHPEWIGDTFVRIENASAVYISQINKVNGELVNYRQRFVLNSTIINKRLSETFITSGPYDGNYYRFGVNSDNKVTLFISDTQATTSELIFANKSAVSQADAKAHISDLTTLKVLMVVEKEDQNTVTVVYTDLDLQNPKQFSDPVELITIAQPTAKFYGIVWSTIGSSFIVLTEGEDSKIVYSYYEIADKTAKLVSTFSEDSAKLSRKTFSLDTVAYTSGDAGDTTVKFVQFVSGAQQPKSSSVDLKLYNISTITSIRQIDAATFAVIGTNSQQDQDNNWIIVLKSGSLAENEAQVHSVTAVDKSVKSTLSIPTSGYSQTDLGLVGLLDENYQTSFGTNTLKYMEMWRQGPHVVFDTSGVSTSQAFTIFSYNIFYWTAKGEIYNTKYYSSIKLVDPAPLSAIPKTNKVPMLDGSSYLLSDLVTVSGYTSDVILKNTSNAFVLPAWPAARDYLNVQKFTAHSAVQGNYVFYDDQAAGLKLTQLGGSTANLITSPTKCAPLRVGSINSENSGFSVFYALCRDLDQNVATQSVFLAFYDKETSKAYTTRYFLGTNALNGLVLPTLRLSSPGSLTVALVGRVNQGSQSGIILGRFVLNRQVPQSSVLKTQFIQQAEGWAASNLFDALLWEDGSTLSVFYAPTYSSKLSVMSFKVGAAFTPQGAVSKITFGADYQYHENSRLNCVWQQGGASSLSVSCGVSGNEVNSFFVKFSLQNPQANGWSQTGLVLTQNLPGLNYTTVVWDGSTALLCGFNTAYKATGAAYTSSRFWMQIVIPESADNSLQAVVATNDAALKPAFLIAPNGSKLVHPGVSMNGNLTVLLPQPTKIQISSARQLSAESNVASLSFRDVAGKTAGPVSLASVFFYKAPTPETPKDNSFSTLIWIIIAASGVVIIFIVAAVVIYSSMKKKGKREVTDQGDGNTVALLNKQGDSNLGSIMIRDSTVTKDLTLTMTKD